MAIATANVAINMNNWQFYETTDLQVTSTQITETHGNDMRTTLYLGSGFSGGVETGILSGELHEIYHYLNGSEQWRVMGLTARDATVVASYLENDSPAVLSYLFAGNDTFNGSASADQLNGYNGNDKINGGLGADRINGGAGNDTITWGNGDIVNGAAGTDVLKLSIDLNLVSLANTKIKNIETINMVGGGQNTLTIGTSDVLALSSSTDTIKITGDDNDIVNIDVPSLGTPTPQGAFMRYEFGLAILLIESDVNVV